MMGEILTPHFLQITSLSTHFIHCLFYGGLLWLNMLLKLKIYLKAMVISRPFKMLI